MFKYDCGAIYLEGDKTPIMHMFMKEPYRAVYYANGEIVGIPLAFNHTADMIRRNRLIADPYQVHMIYHQDLQEYIKNALNIDIPFCAPIFRIQHRSLNEPAKILIPIISVDRLLDHPAIEIGGIMINDISKTLMDPYHLSFLYFTEGFEEFFDGLYERFRIFLDDDTFNAAVQK